MTRWILFFCVGTVLMGQLAQAQFLTSPQPGDIYKEFSRANTSGSQWRVTNSTTTNSAARAYLPNPNLSLNIADLAGAIRAEIVIDLWGGHIGTSGHKFRFNNHAWINIPKLGAANGIPSGQDGYCYINQFNPVVNVPLSNLVQGNNTLQGESGNQLQSCPTYFNWGQWGWFGVMVRVYYNSSKAHATGSITSPTASGVIGENPTITAATSGSVAQVDFLAYYNGVDYDGDGVYQEYHHSYHRQAGENSVVIKNHAGTRTSSPFSVTWNTNLVPSQSGIKVKALIKSTSGVFFVTNEVTGLTLQRTGTVIICKATNVPKKFWVRANQAEMTSNFVIPAGTNLSNATATLAIATWNGVDGEANPGQTHYMKVNNYTLPVFGANHHYKWDAMSIPVAQLVVGTNTFRVRSQSSHHGIEILWPGPSLVLRLATGGGSTAPIITQQPSNQSVSVGQTATFSVQATGTAPLSYQWQKSNVNISGATSASYTTPATTLANNGSTFRCVVSNSRGSVNSNVVTLTVTTGPAPGANVVVNPGFESGTTAWSFYTNGTGGFTSEAPGQDGTRAGKIRIVSTGDNMQLFQAGIRLDANTDYRLSFWAYSSPGKSLGVSLGKHTTPYTGYGLNSVVGLTTGWQQYTRNFRTSGFTGSVSDGRLRFFFDGYATAGTVYYIDAVVLQKITEPSGPALSTENPESNPENVVPTEFTLADNFPNPFNPVTTIRFGLPEQAQTSLGIYNMLGQEVVMLLDENMEAGLHQSVWDGRASNGTQVGSGVYLYRLVATGVSGKVVVVQKKMVLLK